ncbi:MAG TPA: glycosyltransferase family 9 protein [Puia sp.]|jgi:ADP-heptose:LPS heptosyltransferase|nr:glycosyltransferase family 9 protein [Puia sp.]
MSVRAQWADSVKLLCYQVVYHAVKCLPARQKGPRLLLVKTDEIGDYVLLRNLLGLIRHSEAYRGHRITFIGNHSFRQLFEICDAAVADETIWLDKLKFRRSLSYRFSLLKRVRQTGFSDAVNLIYSRSFRVDDLLVAVSTSSNNIGMVTIDSWQTNMERMLTPGHVYHRLEDSGEKTLFDGIRNARFIGRLLDREPAPFSTRLPADVSLPPVDLALPGPYFVVVPGAGNKNKHWPSENFVSLIHHVSRTYNFMPVICGGNTDRAETEPIIRALGKTALDLTGRTTLPELLAILRDARCLISIDTGAVHLAAAVGCPVFGLFSGLHYGRFAPYPSEIASRFFAIYPDETEEKINIGQLIPDTIPMGLMSKIPLEKVIRLIDHELPALLQPGQPTGIQTN